MLYKCTGFYCRWDYIGEPSLLQSTESSIDNVGYRTVACGGIMLLEIIYTFSLDDVDGD
jgi:hypothetical protein